MLPILYREARLSDIPELERVRFAVRENVLRTPGLVTTADYADHLSQRGRGWVATLPDERTVAGFAIADLRGRSIWALFVDPEYAGWGIGKRLHRLMLDWYFGQTTDTVWLSTAPGTRAEEFYRRQGWQQTGHTGSGEVRFEMSAERWQHRSIRDQAFLLLNRVAQDLLPFDAAVKWFDELPTAARPLAMQELHLFVHQAHPSPDVVRVATETAPIRWGATPLALLRALPFRVALPKIVGLRADEHHNAFVALLTVFRLADTHRRQTQCHGNCGHAWHNLPVMD